jgi:hypothetical protein
VEARYDYVEKTIAAAGVVEIGGVILNIGGSAVPNVHQYLARRHVNDIDRSPRCLHISVCLKETVDEASLDV